MLKRAWRASLRASRSTSSKQIDSPPSRRTQRTTSGSGCELPLTPALMQCPASIGNEHGQPGFRGAFGDQQPCLPATADQFSGDAELPISPPFQISDPLLLPSRQSHQLHPGQQVYGQPGQQHPCLVRSEIPIRQLIQARMLQRLDAVLAPPARPMLAAQLRNHVIRRIRQKRGEPVLVNIKQRGFASESKVRPGHRLSYWEGSLSGSARRWRLPPRHPVVACPAGQRVVPSNSSR